MAILEKEVEITITPNIKKYYINLGYKAEVNKKLLVNIDDLSKSSHIRVTKICDDCGLLAPDKKFDNIIRGRKKTGKDLCPSCSMKFKYRKSPPFEKSLEFFATNNKMPNLLKEFSNKNNIEPKDVFSKSNQYFLWNCPDCNSEYDMKVCDRTCLNFNCPYCCGSRINHTNCLWKTHPEIAKILVDKELGYVLSKGTHTVAEFRCDKCDFIIKKNVYNAVRQGVNCPNCSDGLNYPEKFMRNLLQQLDIEYLFQITFEWSKNIKNKNKKLCGNKKYDFYIPSLNCIIETHGGQHYKDRGFERRGGKTIKEEQENDNIKERLAKENGIKYYVIIDCSESDVEFLKNSINKSELAYLLNINNVNWLKCHEYACNSLVKEVSLFWNRGIKDLVVIGNKLNLNIATIRKYLKLSNKLGWADYDPKKVMEEVYSKRKTVNKVEIVQLSITGELINKWESAVAAAKKLNIKSSSINNVLRGKCKISSGFRWMYKIDYDKLQKL